MKTESNTPTRGNQKDLAELMGVSQQAVSQMVKKGIVQVEPDGKILLEQAVEDWQAHVDVGQQRPFKGRGPKPESYQADMQRYHKARADREEAEAKLAQMECEEKAGVLINAEAARKHLMDAILATRDRILNVARRVAPELVGIQSEAVIADKLNHELETALLSLSGDVLYGMVIYSGLLSGRAPASVDLLRFRRHSA